MVRAALLFLFACGATLAAGSGDRDPPLTTAQVLESSQPSDWRRPDPENLLYLELPQGRVIIEFAPRFAPEHVANIKALAREKFYDGLPIARVQDNFVAQWGDVDAARRTPGATRRLPAEIAIPWSRTLPIVKLPDPDGYAPGTGWLDGFPVGVERGRAGGVWMTHCYGALGVGRENWPDNGSGAELYVVIGHAPRQLDRNIVVAGRVLRGIELLSSLPRGTGALGFYEHAEQRTLIRSAHVAADLPETARSTVEVLRTDTPLFSRYVESRRNRRDGWYIRPAGHTDVCAVMPPVRDATR